MTAARAYGLVLAVALAATVTSVANGFVYDDVPAIQQDPRVHTLADPGHLVTIPYFGRTFETDAYRPGTTLAIALVWAAGGGSPVAYHVANVVLNLAVVALVLALALRVLPGGGAVVAALWFAVQPVHVEAVANGVGLAELLAAAAYLGALLAWWADGDAADAGARGGVRRAWLAAAVMVAAALAYATKEHTLTLPAVLLLVDLWRARGDARGAWTSFRRHALLWLATVALALGYLAARGAVLGPAFGGGIVAPGLAGQSLLGRALIMAPAVLVWLRWMVWPLHLSADYLPNHFVPSARLGLPQLVGFAVLAAIAVAAWRARRRMPGVTAGIVFGAVTGSVAANVVVPAGVLLAERMAYLPSVGVALVAGALWARLPRGRYLWPVTAVVLTLLAARTVARIPVWHDKDRFLVALERDAPDSYRTHWARGQEAFDRGRGGEGEREMLAAIRIFPGDPEVQQELGERYLAVGLFGPAAHYLLAAYRLDSTRLNAAVRGVFALLKAGRPDSAAAVGTAALRRAPEAAALLLTTATAEMTAGRPGPALALARRLVFAAPGSWGNQQLAGYAAAYDGRCDEARRRFERAVALAPSEASPRELLGKLRSAPRCGLEPAFASAGHAP